MDEYPADPWAADVEPLQGRDDLWAVIGDQIAMHYRAEAARDAIAKLRPDPVAPTSMRRVEHAADLAGLLTYDVRMQQAGSDLGLAVVAPR